VLKIPTEDSINPQWFNDCFTAAGLTGSVRGFEAARVGTGQIGKCVRYVFDFDDQGNLPLSVIGKYPSDDESSRQTGVALHNFLREVRFYQELQSRVTIRTPRCYYAEILNEGPEFFLLLEDLTPAEQGDQLAGCSPEVAQAALQELVGLQAPAWCDESLHELKWLRDADKVNEMDTMALYRQTLPGFVERYGPHLQGDEIDIIKRVGEAQHTPLNADFPEVFSLVHVDYRLDNLMIKQHDSGLSVAAVDWQSITLGAPMNDVAYFIGAGLEPEVRQPVEEDLVRGYHQGLMSASVVDYSWEDCWLGYRRGAFAGFAVTVVASMLVQRTDRGDTMFTTMARRHARHAIDLNAGEFLT
jgi:hypothetical protein